MAEHSPFGASSAHRWMNCPGCIRMCEGKKPTTNKHAELGTAAHELAEICLKKKIPVERYLGEEIKSGGKKFIVDDEMADAVALYVATITNDTPPGIGIEVEKKFNLDHIDKDLWGTNDCSSGEVFGRLRIYDYKHGMKLVEVMDNPQLMYYALGAMRTGDFEEVEIIIVQPRASHVDGPVRRQLFDRKRIEGNPAKVKSVDDLIYWGNVTLKNAVKAAKAPNAPLVYGSWCTYCLAMGECPKALEQALLVAKSDFAPEVTVNALTDEQLAEVLPKLDTLVAFKEACFAEAYARIKTGASIPGYKHVKKKSNRAWSDEEAVKDTFEVVYGENIYEPRNLKSPAKLVATISADLKLKGSVVFHKKAADKMVEGLCYKPDTGTTIAPISDKRPEVESDPRLDFLDPIFL